MDCQESQNLMAAYIDKELDTSTELRYAAHLNGCQTCSDAFQQILDVSMAVKTHARQYSAPEQLRQRIQSALPHSVASPSAFSQLHTPVPARRRLLHLPKLSWGWINFGVASTSAVAFMVTLSLYLAAPSAEQEIEQDVVASHARSLMVSHLSDVISTDQHTVKPWFSDKLDFSPTVYDFTPQGFSLIGGRLDYLNQRPVAALAYRHRLHTLNLFEWPEKKGDKIPALTALRQGYHLNHWTLNSMEYWLISDMNAQDLSNFRDLLVAQIEKGDKSEER